MLLEVFSTKRRKTSEMDFDGLNVPKNIVNVLDKATQENQKIDIGMFQIL